jgi:hypothetical protein
MIEVKRISRAFVASMKNLFERDVNSKAHEKPPCLALEDDTIGDAGKNACSPFANKEGSSCSA